MNSQFEEAIAKRRTFAIISHPDAGKTTLTEKLLLYGGAIQMAGRVKARGRQRRARSDWMRVERERGISVTTSVMTFEYGDCLFNLLDTPGHEDFCEDTYRTLTAVDSAVMVIDAAKGIEAQTLKLFRVCRMRNVPIITYINKLDRDSRDPFDLLSEIEERLSLDVTPITWPVGMGTEFLGCYDLMHRELLLLERSERDIASRGITTRFEDAAFDQYLPVRSAGTLKAQVEMVQGLCPAFSLEAYRAGKLTPVFFGSALNSFGIRELLRGLIEYAPPPQAQLALEREVQPNELPTTGFVFKIQANMDPQHHDRIAYLRVCSGQLHRGMKLFHVRSSKTLVLHNPVMLFARDRGLVEDASPGDIIGIPNHRSLFIGDTLTEGESLHYSCIPGFAPELLRIVCPVDPMRAKHLNRALEQLAEEGIARIFRIPSHLNPIVGVVGALQFDVLADRIRTEYNIPVQFQSTSFSTARWIVTESDAALRRFIKENEDSIASDHTGAHAFLVRGAWQLEQAKRDWLDIRFSESISGLRDRDPGLSTQSLK